MVFFHDSNNPGFYNLFIQVSPSFYGFSDANGDPRLMLLFNFFFDSFFSGIYLSKTEFIFP